MRLDGRENDQLRKVSITPDFMPNAEGSVLIKVGDTHVICTATIDATVPRHIKGSGTGWITAEYSMLPRSSSQRIRRERGTKLGGRTQEIQRLIGRSLRSVVDLSKLGENTILIDCDVIRADGGTRTSSITGSFVAMALALKTFKNQTGINEQIISQYMASISAGIVDDEPYLDLCYEEDYKASVDMNIVMTESEEFVEIQGSGEESTFSLSQTNNLFKLTNKGIQELIKMQKEIISDLP